MILSKIKHSSSIPLPQTLLEVVWMLQEMVLYTFSYENKLQYKHFQKERLGLNVIPRSEDVMWLVYPLPKFFLCKEDLK